MDRDRIVRMVEELFDRAGGEQYVGEEVTQREYALHCAFLATEVGAKPPLITTPDIDG